MKKNIVFMLCSWFLLVASVILVYKFAINLNPDIEAPEIVAIYTNNDDVTLKWSYVDYATIYSIHRKTETGNWEFVKSVKSSNLTYTDIGAADDNYQYAVRACNVSFGVFHWSNFSKTAFVP